LIRELEAIGRACWPAEETVVLDGWLLCFSPGTTRRTHSVHPVDDGTLPVDERIALCEARYRERGSRTVFKLTDEVRPHDLEAVLERRGYRLEDPTSVQVLDLQQWRGAVSDPIGQRQQLDDAWLAAAARCNEWSDERIPPLRGVFERIAPPCVFAGLREDDRIVAQALGVLRDGQLGCFDIATDPSCRGRGLGERLVRGLLGWGRERGAQRAFLQVVVENAPAQGLYRKLGFQEAYRYWYRSSLVGPA